jgi:hypothetical protein
MRVLLMRESEKNVVNAGAAVCHADVRVRARSLRRRYIPRDAFGRGKLFLFAAPLVCFDQKLPRKQSAIKIRNQE